MIYKNIPKDLPPLPDQGKFWEDLAEKRRQLYNSKLEQVRQTAESILGPGAGPNPGRR